MKQYQAVGKSCLVMQFIEGKALKKHETTIGVEFGVKEIYINNQPIKISIWDTAGQESFRSLVRSYYRSAIGVLLVYDMTNKQSFHNLQKWLEEIKENGDESITIINGRCNCVRSLQQNRSRGRVKTSQTDRREVSSDEGRQFAEQNGFMFFETSALEGTNVTEAFRQTAMTIDDKIVDGTIKLGKHVLHYLWYKQVGVIVGGLYQGNSQPEYSKLDQTQSNKSKQCC